MVEDELSVGDQESNGHSDRAPALLYGEKGQLFLKLSTNKACMVEWSDGSHTSGKDT